ncbi:CerR family C-terminal domain-containing protein [Desulfosarcina sp. OttesenSCG-928-A07]|nr:CerR family C-terminal domain-containing protein [Desulfosarcina sp. OttesenSCG-928-A07]
MTKRKDGQITRQKILDAACDIFSEKGFRQARVTEICKRAGINLAAVNYYFGDKKNLYVEAWRQAMDQFMVSDVLPPRSLPPEERLRQAIRNIIQKVLDDRTGSHFRRIELMELANPTGLIDDAWRALIAPRQEEMFQLIRDIMGPDVPEESVRLCKMSIINQCRGYILNQKSRMGMMGEAFDTSTDQADRIAEHITCFSIAGIRAVCSRNTADF